MTNGKTFVPDNLPNLLENGECLGPWSHDLFHYQPLVTEPHRSSGESKGKETELSLSQGPIKTVKKDNPQKGENICKS